MCKLPLCRGCYWYWFVYMNFIRIYMCMRVTYLIKDVRIFVLQRLQIYADWLQVLFVTWLIHTYDMTRWSIHMCGMTHLYLWHDGQDVTHSRVWHDVCDMTHWYVWHDLFILVTWLTSGSDWLRVLCVTSLIDVCNLTHSCVSPDALMCVTWLIHMCNMIYVRADWLRVLCLRCLIHICDVNGVCLCSVRVLSHSWPHSSHMCDRTERCAWHDSFICVRVVSISWHDEMCDMDHSYSCVTW